MFEKKIISRAWFGEVDYLLYPWFIGSLRFGGAYSHQNDNDLDKSLNISPNITLLARENVRFTIEGLFEIEQDKTDNKGFIVKAVNNDKLKWVKINALLAF